MLSCIKIYQLKKIDIDLFRKLMEIGLAKVNEKTKNLNKIVT